MSTSRRNPAEDSQGLQPRVVDLVRRWYSGSRDFNGVLALHVLEEIGLSRRRLNALLRKTISDGLLEIVDETWFPNPHIRPFDGRSIEEQVGRLESLRPDSFCIYPTALAMKGHRLPARHSGRPYAARLWRGKGQLSPAFFDMAVLERYRTDPRYRFQFHDNGGMISIADEYYAANDFPARDKILVQTFGLGYDRQGGRVVAVFLSYLANLSPEHQQAWRSFERHDACQVNGDYMRSALGHWPTHQSLFRAVLVEQGVINRMADAIGRPHLFRRTFEHDRPPNFHSFFVPTKANYRAFVLELDKLLSQNLDSRFFNGEVPAMREVPLQDGRIREERIATINQLERWLRDRFVTEDANAVDRVITPFRKARRERQEPAHGIATDEYSLDYWTRQDDLMRRIYSALRTLRLILANHPGAETVDVPDWLEAGRIRLH